MKRIFNITPSTYIHTMKGRNIENYHHHPLYKKKVVLFLKRTGRTVHDNLIHYYKGSGRMFGCTERQMFCVYCFVRKTARNQLKSHFNPSNTPAYGELHFFIYCMSFY